MLKCYTMFCTCLVQNKFNFFYANKCDLNIIGQGFKYFKILSITFTIFGNDPVILNHCETTVTFCISASLIYTSVCYEGTTQIKINKSIDNN